MCAVQVVQQADTEERSSKTPRLDPALELEALRERIRALQLENERLQEAAAAAELRAGAAELRAVAAEARAAAVAAPPKLTRTEAELAVCSAAGAARISCPSPPASSTASSSGDSGNGAATLGTPSALTLAHSLVQQAVRFERTGVEALVEAYDQVDGLHTVSASGRSWREALVGRSAVAFTRVPPEPAALPPPPRRTLRAPCPVRTGVARVGLGRAHQAKVPVWPHGGSPKVPRATATDSLERGDAQVSIHDADVLRAQRVAFNAWLLTAEPRRRWPDAGAQRFALGPTSARKLLAYVCDPANRDARGRLRLDDAEGTVLGGYGNYRATHAAEAGARHSEAEQAKHTLLLSREVLDLARDALPGLDALVEGVLRQLPEAEADSRTLMPLHGHILDQGSSTARFADHQDTEEEVAEGAHTPDRRVVYTVVIALSDGGDTAMRILGQEELAFTGEAGSGVAFRSALWHRTERASAGVWKLALFYGYLL